MMFCLVIVVSYACSRVSTSDACIQQNTWNQSSSDKFSSVYTSSERWVGRGSLSEGGGGES